MSVFDVLRYHVTPELRKEDLEVIPNDILELWMYEEILRHRPLRDIIYNSLYTIHPSDINNILFFDVDTDVAVRKSLYDALIKIIKEYEAD